MELGLTRTARSPPYLSGSAVWSSSDQTASVPATPSTVRLFAALESIFDAPVEDREV
jgi:hypothetical protein